MATKQDHPKPAQRTSAEVAKDIAEAWVEATAVVRSLELLYTDITGQRVQDRTP